MSVLVGDRAPSAEQAAEFRRAFGCAAQIPDQLLLTATVTNPLSDIARSNEPVRIGVTFDSGVVADLSRLVVRDQAGQAVPWQWEPCRHSRTDADISRWPNGSYKAGYIWVMLPSLAAGASTTYTVSTDEAASLFAPAVVFSQPDGNTDRFDTPLATADFTAAWGWNLSGYTDKASGSNCFSAADAGLDFSYKPTNAGTTESVGLTTGSRSATVISKSHRDADSFGYGVVYREFETINQFATETRLRCITRYRVYANGEVDCWNTHLATAEIPTTDLKLLFSVIKPNAAGGTHVTTESNTKLLIKSEYGAGKFLFAYRSYKNGSDADQAVYGGMFPGTGGWLTASPIRLRVGANAPNRAVPAGSIRQQWLSVMRTDDYDLEELRFWNPLVTHAARVDSVSDALSRFRTEAADFLRRYAEYSVADTGSGKGWIQPQRVAALVNYSLVGGPDVWAQVPVAIQEWLDHDSRGGSDGPGLGLNLFNRYKAGGPAAGWQHTGRDVQAFWQLRLDAIERGDAAVQQRCENIIYAIADFAVRAEADNGSTGRIVLDTANPENPNATAEALIALVFARSINRAEAGWATVRDRVWNALIAGFWFRNWTPYLFNSATTASGCIGNQVLSYYHRVMLGVYIGKTIGGLTTTVDPVYSLLASTNPAGSVLDNLDNYNHERRGSGATSMHFAANLAWYGNQSEIERATQIMARVREQTPVGEPSPYPMDGWQNPLTRGSGDALCAMLMGLALRRS